MERRYLFVVILYSLCNNLGAELKIGDNGVCPSRSRESSEPECCIGWKYNPRLDKCLPKCRFGCGEGKCVGYNKCSCDRPLMYHNKKCILPTCHIIPCIDVSCTNHGGFNYTCVCNKGYVDEYTCIPKCSNQCVNGVCSAPNTCSCNEGYEKLDASICKPICNGCDNGECIAPYNCKCKDGYERKEEKCKPICKDCENGDCIAPNICNCKKGYTKQEEKCKPFCNDCENGDCIGPNDCKCRDGYERQEEKCKPICNDCENGVCLAPYNCSCNKGYTKQNNKCVATCDQNCSNGFCSGPNICTCNEGHKKHPIDKFKCHPSCEPGCVNSICVAPNKCKCNEGYFDSNGECIPRCTKPCSNGFCSAPEECTCEKGYRMDNSSMTCQPICHTNCVNATCVRPNECECLEGFIKSSNFVCKPKCPSCENGRCIDAVRPTCLCNIGYNMIDGSCRPVCKNKCINGICSKPDVCTCNEGYTSNLTNPWICEKPCRSCNNGLCNIEGECVCKPGFQYDNSSCIPITVDCSTCASHCTENECWCNDSRPCAKPDNTRVDSLAHATTGLAGLEMAWVGGAVGVTILLAAAIIIIGYTWRRQQDYRTKERDTAAYPYGSVAYTVAGTLKNQNKTESTPNFYSEATDNEEKVNEEKETTEGLLS